MAGSRVVQHLGLIPFQHDSVVELTRSRRVFQGNYGPPNPYPGFVRQYALLEPHWKGQIGSLLHGNLSHERPRDSEIFRKWVVYGRYGSALVHVLDNGSDISHRRRSHRERLSGSPTSSRRRSNLLSRFWRRGIRKNDRGRRLARRCRTHSNNILSHRQDTKICLRRPGGQDGLRDQIG